ncbi:TolC family protein [Tenacibaculum sp. SG-28]|uniref:TolC family protein n=1 Tax=Tenacibaculum sp. SG-28 TaxID=754426 RepID=UPI001E497023|nr:TolC family protein [Tenacibaculum sp. SG-28]
MEFKANFEENSGNYLNPEATLPDGGLYSAGVSVSLAQGFLINERMAAVKKAKIFMQQTKAERELAVNTLLVKASEAYFMWLEAYQEQKIYHRFLKNAAIRLEGIKRNVVVGEKAPIDSVEAKIAMQSRRLNAEQAKLKTRKAMLYASNYLWMANIPLQIQENITPVIPEANTIATSLSFKTMEELEFAMANHPKIRNLESKIAALEVDNALKKNKLLPKVDLQYNFLASDVNAFSNFNTANYKAFVNLSFPLFLRKERGDLKLNKYKLQEIKFERTTTALAINNKIEAIQTEISSLEEQTSLIEAMVVNYTLLLAAEERKFTLGDSSLFVINAREQKLIAAALKANTITVKTLLANVSLFEAYGKANLNDTNYNSTY